MPKLALIHWARLLTVKNIPFQLPRPSQISDGAKPLLFVAINNVVEIVEIPLSKLVQMTVGGERNITTAQLIGDIRTALADEQLSNAGKKYSIRLKQDDGGAWIIEGDSHAIQSDNYANQGDNKGSENRHKLYKDYCAWLKKPENHNCIWGGVQPVKSPPHHNPDACSDSKGKKADANKWLKYFSERGYFSGTLTLGSQCASRYNSFKQEIVEAGLCDWNNVDELCKGIDKDTCIMRGTKHHSDSNPLDLSLIHI